MEPIWRNITIPDGQYDPRITPQRGLAHGWFAMRHFTAYEGRRHPEAIPLGFEGTMTMWVDLPADFTPRTGWGTGPLNLHDSPIPNGWRGVSPVRIMMQPDGLGLYLEYTAGTEATLRRRRKVPIEPYIGAGPVELTLHLRLSQGSDGYAGMAVNGEMLFPIENSPNMRPSDHEVLAWAGYYYPATGERGHTNPGVTRLRVAGPILRGTSPLGPPIAPVEPRSWGSYGRSGHPNATIDAAEPVGAPAPPSPEPPPVPKAFDVRLMRGSTYGELAADLDGATVSGPLYVEAVVSPKPARVMFYLDGEVAREENYHPWNLNGTGAVQDTTEWSEGEHTIRAEVVDPDTDEVLAAAEATFTVRNDPADDPPDDRDQRIAELQSQVAELEAKIAAVDADLDEANVILQRARGRVSGGSFG